MLKTETKSYWENIYQNKQPHEVSWTQEVPEPSLSLIQQLEMPKSAAIIDVGGGDGLLVDFLLAEGYQNITVLDISEAAIKRAQKRLGAKSDKVHWVVEDVLSFKPKKNYDLWHDRAAFHFQTKTSAVNQYLKVLRLAQPKHLIVGTFSEQGPQKCSGLDIQQYDTQKLSALFEKENYTTMQTVYKDHLTPMGTVQNFIFSCFSIQ